MEGSSKSESNAMRCPVDTGLLRYVSPKVWMCEICGRLWRKKE